MLIEDSNNDYVEQGRPAKAYHAMVESRAQLGKMPAGERLQL